MHVAMADAAVRLGPAAPAESYLRIDAIVEAARSTGAEAIHPGYGFLAERAAFARAVESAGLVFVGPSSATIDALGDKLHARRLARSIGVDPVPGTLEPAAVDRADAVGGIVEEAEAIGFPLLVKAAAGGGGRGMRRVAEAERVARGTGGGLGRGAVRLRRRCRLPRARDPPGAPHRGPVAGRLDRSGHRPRRAGLLAPASPPEAGRGGARAGPDRGGAAGPARPGRPDRDGRRAPQRRHLRVPALAGRRLPLPRGQHPAAGGARHHGAGDRPGPRARTVPPGRRRAAVGWRPGRRRARRYPRRPRHRSPPDRRGPVPRLRPDARHGPALADAGRSWRPRRHRPRRGRPDPARVRQPDREGHGPCGRSGRRARSPGAGRSARSWSPGSRPRCRSIAWVAREPSFRAGDLSTDWVGEHWDGPAQRALAVERAVRAAGEAAIDGLLGGQAAAALPAARAGTGPANGSAWRAAGRADVVDRWPR